MIVTTPTTNTNIGFSLSPGGLLYPYHIGALAGLEYNNFLTPSSPIAGASAGAIAVASHAANLKPEVCLETTIRICNECTARGGARGRLLDLLKDELEAILEDDSHHTINDREGMVALAYYELFPNNRPILQTYFDTRDELIETILNSSMFPFFSSNFPFRIIKNNNNKQNDKKNDDTDKNTGIFGGSVGKFFQSRLSSLPRVVVDGYFAVPLNRFGCPDFNLAFNTGNSKNSDSYMDRILKIEDRMEDQLALDFVETSDKEEASSKPPKHHHIRKHIDRTVTISVFPHDSVLMTASQTHDRISPLYDSDNPIGQVSELLRLATQPLTKDEVYKLYDNGFSDVERWINEEKQRQRMLTSDVFNSYITNEGELN